MTLELTQDHHFSCPSCGLDLRDTLIARENAEKMIDELKYQIELLNDKLTAAVEKLADNEDKKQTLVEEPQEQVKSPVFFGSYSLSPFIGYRRRSEKPSVKTSQHSSSELMAELTRERSLRKAAESELRRSSGEIEELSAQVFMKANEMVAVERKARARLESRVEMLEKKGLERDQRLARLESAIQRIERIRSLLAPEDKN